MAVPDSLVLASEVIGFLSFAFTLLTALGVYSDLIKTLRGAPSSIPITLGNLREEIRYEQLLCKQKVSSNNDQFHILPAGKRPGKKGRHELNRLWMTTLRHLWTEFCNIEQRFLLDGEMSPKDIDADIDNNYVSSATEKTEKVDYRRGNGRPAPPNRQSYIRGRMGWVEAGLSQDRQTYYNTDLAHRILWWWKKDDVSELAKQVQRLQVRRIERDSYESNLLIKRALRIYGRVSGDDIYSDSDNTNSDDGNGGGGSGSDGGGPRGGGPVHHRRRRKHSNGKRDSRSIGQRSSRPHSPSRNGRDHGDVRVVELSEKESIRRRAPSPDFIPNHASRRPQSTVVVGSRQPSVSRRSVVYEYEVVDPGRVHIEYDNSRHDRPKSLSQSQRRTEDR